MNIVLFGTDQSITTKWYDSGSMKYFNAWVNGNSMSDIAKVTRQHRQINCAVGFCLSQWALYTYIKYIHIHHLTQGMQIYHIHREFWIAIFNINNLFHIHALVWTGTVSGSLDPRGRSDGTRGSLSGAGRIRNGIFITRRLRFWRLEITREWSWIRICIWWFLVHIYAIYYASLKRRANWASFYQHTAAPGYSSI